jgi:hypothetical protein
LTMKGEDSVDNKVKEIRIKKGLSQEEIETF